jgi:uncharacterized membrane protein
MPRLDERFVQGEGNHTLNAFDWMDYASWTSATGQTFTMQDDLAAINWFNDNVSGTPVIAEAMLGPYRGDGSRFSIATGFPDMLGWDRHESQQRYVSDISERSQDLRRLYRSTDTAEKVQILQEYDVAYVIVGDIERYGIVSDIPGDKFATAEGIEAFERMVGEGLEIAFQHGNTTVYRVVPSEFTSGGGAS